MPELDFDKFRGVPVHPLPASEVRRLGDRRRRRTRAMAVAGSALAVALVAAPIALFAAGADHDSAPPVVGPTRTTTTPSTTPTTVPTTTPTSPASPSGSSWSPAAVDPVAQHREISADYPLLDGWPTAAESAKDGPRGPNRTLAALTFDACGSRFSDSTSSDRLTATYKNPEDNRQRDLLVFPVADDAVGYVDRITAFFQSCSTEHGQDGYDYPNHVQPLQVGGQSVAILRPAEFNGAAAPQLDIVTVVRLGRGVLVEDDYSEGGGPDPRIQAALQAQLDAQSAPIAAMCVFTAAGCGSGDQGAPAPHLGPTGYGALQLGMPFAQANDTGLLAHPQAPSGTGCGAFELAGFAHRAHQVDGYVSADDGVDSIYARPGVTTPEGIGLGSTLQQVRAAYPKAYREVSGWYADIAGTPHRYYFGIDHGKVTELGLQHKPSMCVS